MESEFDILKKNIRELVELSNSDLNLVRCKLCTYYNQALKNIAKETECEVCGIKLESLLINKLEIKRLKGIINYYLLDDSYKNFITMNKNDFYKPTIYKESSMKRNNPCVIIMRHGIREDFFIGPRKVVDEVLNFYDKEERPYDPPLLDYDIPKLRANQLLAKYNITTIVSSPFRRCLQTAGIIAKVLSIPSVDINSYFGEKCTELRKHKLKFNTDINIIREAINPPTVFNNNKTVEGIINEYNDGCNNNMYAYGDTEDSLKKAIETEISTFDCDSNECLLIITHGDNVSNPIHFLPDRNKFFSNSVECGYISFEIKKTPVKILGLDLFKKSLGDFIEINGGLNTMQF
jgi:broad specificity phosphatase PhoE